MLCVPEQETAGQRHRTKTNEHQQLTAWPGLRHVTNAATIYIHRCDTVSRLRNGKTLGFLNDYESCARRAHFVSRFFTSACTSRPTVRLTTNCSTACERKAIGKPGWIFSWSACAILQNRPPMLQEKFCSSSMATKRRSKPSADRRLRCCASFNTCNAIRSLRFLRQRRGSVFPRPPSPSHWDT